MCGETYVVNRPMDASNEPSPCPQGHVDTVRLLTVAAAADVLLGQVLNGSANSAALRSLVEVSGVTTIEPRLIV